MITAVFRKRLSELTEGESAKEISIKTHFTPKYAEDFLNGKRCPDIFDLCRIADAYNVTTDYLLGRTEEKEPAQAAAGQAQKETNNTLHYTNSIAQPSEIVKNFTDFLPILLEFARQHFGEIELQSIESHNITDEKVYIHRSAEVTFTNSKGGKYCMILEEMEAEQS